MEKWSRLYLRKYGPAVGIARRVYEQVKRKGKNHGFIKFEEVQKMCSLDLSIFCKEIVMPKHRTYNCAILLQLICIPALWHEAKFDPT